MLLVSLQRVGRDAFFTSPLWKLNEKTHLRIGKGQKIPHQSVPIINRHTAIKWNSCYRPQRSTFNCKVSFPGLATNSIFSACFNKKISLICPPSTHQGKLCSLLFLPVTPLSQSRNLKGLLELAQRPTRGLNLTS